MRLLWIWKTTAFMAPNFLSACLLFVFCLSDCILSVCISVWLFYVCFRRVCSSVYISIVYLSSVCQSTFLLSIFRPFVSLSVCKSFLSLFRLFVLCVCLFWVFSIHLFKSGSDEGWTCLAEQPRRGKTSWFTFLFLFRMKEKEFLNLFSMTKEMCVCQKDWNLEQKL
jgi:hypothetical protein